MCCSAGVVTQSQAGPGVMVTEVAASRCPAVQRLVPEQLRPCATEQQPPVRGKDGEMGLVTSQGNLRDNLTLQVLYNQMQ